MYICFSYVVNIGIVLPDLQMCKPKSHQNCYRSPLSMYGGGSEVGLPLRDWGWLQVISWIIYIAELVNFTEKTVNGQYRSQKNIFL